MNASEYRSGRDGSWYASKRENIDAIHTISNSQRHDTLTTTDKIVARHVDLSTRIHSTRHLEARGYARLEVVLQKALHSAEEVTWALLGTTVAAAMAEITRGRVSFVSANEPTSPSRYKCLHDIVLLERLPANWAGSNTIAVGSRVAHIASAIVRLLPDVVLSPQVTSSGDGDVGMTWIKAGKKIEVTIDQDEFVAWVAKFSSHRYSGATKWTDEIPPDLLKWLLSAHK